MDVTWGIFTGHIPISHLFAYYGMINGETFGSDSVYYIPPKFS